MSWLSMIPAAVSAGTAIYGAIRSKKAPKEAHERTKELQDRQHEKQKQMWEETNYPAQKEQMQKAGINPGLLYGMGGTGGATTGGASAGQGAQEQVYDLSTATSQAAQIAAQIELAKSQADKNRAEAEKIKGVDTEQTKASTELTKITAQFENLKKEISGNTQHYQEERIVEEANSARYNAMQEARRAEITDETYQDVISTIKTEAIQAMLGTKLTEQQITTMITQIEQRYEELRLQGKSIQQSKENTEKIAEAMLWGAGIHAAGSIVNNVIDVATMPKTITKEVTKETIQRGKKWQTKDVTRTRE